VCSKSQKFPSYATGFSLQLMTQQKQFILRTSGEFSWRVGLLPDRKNFGTVVVVPSELSPNKFGTQKVRHQPLAEASGMVSFRTLSSQGKTRLFDGAFKDDGETFAAA